MYGDTVICYYPLGDIFREFPNPNAPNPSVYLGSSSGPSRDGRIKPDISAPGTYIISSGNSIFISNAIGSGDPNNYRKVAQGSKHVRNTGTSMASPMVTGAVALYLQKNPDADWREIKTAFLTTAFKDTFTTQQPNNKFGYGKLHAFNALLTDFVYGCTDTAALNYDPNANTDDGSCVQIVYGCMDPIAVNFDSLANFDNGTCQYDTTLGIGKPTAAGVGLVAYPNPNQGSFTVVYSLPDGIANAYVVITDLLGKETARINISGPNGNVAVQALAKGVYLYAIEHNGLLLKPGKVVVQ